MLCAYPRGTGGRLNGREGEGWPCGRCMPCRINTQRKKVGRLILEAQTHEKRAFLTLTYADRNLSHKICEGMVEPILMPTELTRFLKRLRARTNPFRYMAVGEYGPETWRPHYHAMVFGLGQEDLEHQELLLKTWGKGHVSTGEADIDRMRYIAHYTLKKMTRDDDLKLYGRTPEFSRQSRMPGLGHPYIKHLVARYETHAGSLYLIKHQDVARAFRHDGRIWPLDYYMLQKLRGAIGLPKDAADRPDPPPFDLPGTYPARLHKARAFHKKGLAKVKNHGTL